jgi:hypothetical protein
LIESLSRKFRESDTSSKQFQIEVNEEAQLLKLKHKVLAFALLRAKDSELVNAAKRKLAQDK